MEQRRQNERGTITKEFEVEVEVLILATVTLTIEGTTIDEVTERVENGEFEDEVIAEIDSGNFHASLDKALELVEGGNVCHVP